MSQNQAILNHLKSGGALTALDCLTLCGCLRAAARVRELRESGHSIRTRMEEVNGKRIAVYSLGNGVTLHNA